MAAFLNVCRFTPTAGSTTDWTYSSAVTGYQSPSAAGVVNGRVYKYRAESADLSQWEIGEGAYNTGTGVLARTTVLYNSSGTGTATGQSGAGTKINFSAAPQVAIVGIKEDLISIEEANSFTSTQKSQAQANIGVVCAPSGRITLATGVPVMSSSQSGKTTVYYTPYAGNIVPIYDGTNMVPTQFSELSQATTDSTKSPAAVAASKVYDLFVWNDSGTIRCTRGPAWTNSTTRGYTFTVVNGIALNTSSITNGPGASRGTWVGTIASNGSSTIDFTFGGTGSNGVAGAFYVWNAYNRVNVGCVVVDNSASYTYTSATIRQAHASSTMQVDFVNGAQEDIAQLSYQIYIVIGAGFCRGGIGIDSTTTFSSYAYVLNNQVSTTILNWNATIGTHTITALEAGDGANSETYNQNGTANLLGLCFAFRM